LGQVVTAAGTRSLALESWGPEEGYPVFLLHGTPGSRLGPRPRTRDLHLLGIRLIAHDRPGYGGSDRLKDRRVDHAAADVAAIADHLGIKRFSVVGRSGGGPHALACAALLPDRVENAAVLVSLAPPDAEGLSWFDGMTASNIHAFELARDDHELLREELIHRRSAVNADPQRMIASLDPELSAGDRRIVREIEVRRMLVDNFGAAFDPNDRKYRPKEERAGAAAANQDRNAPDYGSHGWFDDVVSFAQPWGFPVSDVNVPVLLWHGELDRFSPLGHFTWLSEHIERVTPVMAMGTAHFGAVPILPRILRWLADPANRAVESPDDPAVRSLAERW
jgi:pimeloyl-ACP methyl ester carboxylesterase